MKLVRIPHGMKDKTYDEVMANQKIPTCLLLVPRVCVVPLLDMHQPQIQFAKILYIYKITPCTYIILK
jgi:hypothetical protein